MTRERVTPDSDPEAAPRRHEMTWIEAVVILALCLAAFAALLLAAQVEKAVL